MYMIPEIIYGIFGLELGCSDEIRGYILSYQAIVHVEHSSQPNPLDK